MTPYFTFSAPSAVPSLSKPPWPVLYLRASMAVKVGSTSTFRLAESPVKPSMTPICATKPAIRRDTGNITAISSLLEMRRTIWKPHRCTSLTPRAG